MKPEWNRTARGVLRSGLALGALVGWFVCGQPASAQDRLYAAKYPGLWELDPNTGAPLGYQMLTPQNCGFTTGFTWWNGRMIDVGYLGPSYYLQVLSIHPADAFVTASPPIGDNYSPMIDTHPPTGVMYMIGSNPAQLFTLNPLTGQRTYIAHVTGAQTGPRAMAIRSDGAAFVVLASRFLATLDLSTGIVTPIAYLQSSVPPGLQFGGFTDLAFDSQDQLWGAYYYGNIGPGGILYSGLYRIDMNAHTAVRVYAYNENFAIAFGPDCTCSTYCTGKQNSAGCVPSIARDGLPSPTAHWGFQITGTHATNQTSGTLAWSVSGRAANPFHNGTWCVRSPLRRTPVQSSGGTASGLLDCSGTWSLDFNTYMQSNGLLPAGTTIDCQWYGRDPGSPPPHNVQLSNALEFVLMP